MQALGNASVTRYQVNNLVIGNIGAVATLEVAVNLAGVAVGDGGICVPEVAFTAGIAINPVRATGAGTAAIPFVNASAGAIDPADTFEFDIFMFRAVGQQLTAT